MSRASVGMVIDKLLTDDNLRIRFALDRVKTLGELCLRGFDLTRGIVRIRVSGTMARMRGRREFATRSIRLTRRGSRWLAASSPSSVDG